MKLVSIFVSLLFVTGAVAQQPDASAQSGVIYGTVIDRQGQPAKGLRLTATPIGLINGILPGAKTDENGRYRFERLPWWGPYDVYADDENAGYSEYSTGPGHRPTSDVILSAEHPEAEFNFQLPPKAGFVHIHLTNMRTGAIISGMFYHLEPQDDPRLFQSGSSGSDYVILIPPDKDMLLHITDPGFLEWRESVGTGKLIRLASGDSATFDVQLEPAE